MDDDPVRTRACLITNAVNALDVAGPRESKRPSIYEQARAFLAMLAESEETQPTFVSPAALVLKPLGAA